MGRLHEKNSLTHYGIPKRSGRYPWGSGERPYQGDEQSKKIKSDRAQAVKKENLRKMSAKELNDRIERLEKEKKLKSLTDADLRPGRTETLRILKTIGTTVGVAAASVAIFYTLGKVGSSTKKETVAYVPKKNEKVKERYKYTFNKEEFRKTYNVAEMFELTAKKGLKNK